MLAGLAAAAVTLLARRTNDSTLATVGAALSLVIAGLILDPHRSSTRALRPARNSQLRLTN